MSAIMEKYLKKVNSMTELELKQALIDSGALVIEQTQKLHEEFFGSETTYVETAYYVSRSNNSYSIKATYSPSVQTYDCNNVSSTFDDNWEEAA
ncbi:hypothetical protein SANA_25070 [Gottschalkiaceae bacterium SANA]|nr:hypothetical protein SANA_25070 [Gottschalkiaceae bacterium SANA]